MNKTQISKLLRKAKSEDIITIKINGETKYIVCDIEKGTHDGEMTLVCRESADAFIESSIRSKGIKLQAQDAADERKFKKFARQFADYSVAVIKEIFSNIGYTLEKEDWAQSNQMTYIYQYKKGDKKLTLAVDVANGQEVKKYIADSKYFYNFSKKK